MTVTDITSESHFNELTTSLPSGTPIVISFHTPWAAPCTQMNAVFSYLSTQYSNITFLSVDAESHPEISETFEVSAVPFFVFVQHGKVVRELSGADPKELTAAIQQVTGQKPSATASDNSNTTISNQADSKSNNNNNDNNNNNNNSNNTSNDNDNNNAASAEKELNARLEKLVAAAPVMLFMKGTPAAPQCGFSRQLVGILREKQVRFGFFDILKDDAVRQGLKKFSDWPTFPQLYINGELQGGLDIVKEILTDDPEFFSTINTTS
ncbi:thioredoxin-like protein [Lipomyces japonicus]|uniref:thioredoxin-like protein n=1 Tax=Lipomyces japonicus TaxID=56871 RepID=UPI0034CD08F7